MREDGLAGGAERGGGRRLRGPRRPARPLPTGTATPAAGPLTRRPPLRREFRHKRNITFNDNDTVSYLEYRTFQFQPDMSNGLESDYIVMPNILVLVRLHRRPAPPPARPPLPRPPRTAGPFAGPACGSRPDSAR